MSESATTERKIESVAIRVLVSGRFWPCAWKISPVGKGQFNKLEFCIGKIRPIFSGVPQCSILGWDLYYFLSISKIFLSQLLIFLTASGTRLDILLDDVDNRLCTVYEWLCGNKLTRPRIFPKLNILSLYLGKRKNKDLYPPLQIENICLEQSSFIKYLGVYIDLITRHDHIDYTSSKICKNLNILTKLRSHLTITTLRCIRTLGK